MAGSENTGMPVTWVERYVQDTSPGASDRWEIVNGATYVAGNVTHDVALPTGNILSLGGSRSGLYLSAQEIDPQNPAFVVSTDEFANEASPFVPTP